MKVGDMVKIRRSPTSSGGRRLYKRSGVGKIGIVIGISRVNKDYDVMTTVKVKWLDTQSVTEHNDFFVEVINESR